MVKKQILSCSVFILVLLVAKVVQQDGFANVTKNEDLQWKVWKHDEDVALNGWKNAYLEGLHFANEKIPFEDVVVEKRILSHLKNYSKNSQSQHFVKQGNSKTLKMVAEILKSHGIPADFKYIPIIESNLEVDALSPKGAFGYWQFMPSTARSYGLVVNSEVDERQDLVKSTHAAARYFKALHKEFGNWALVAAAYNVGDGNLRKAIERQKEDNFFKLKLNSETTNYVYKIIALKEVIERPDQYKYELKDKTLYAWDAQVSNNINSGVL